MEQPEWCQCHSLPGTAKLAKCPAKPDTKKAETGNGSRLAKFYAIRLGQRDLIAGLEGNNGLLPARCAALVPSAFAPQATAHIHGVHTVDLDLEQDFNGTAYIVFVRARVGNEVNLLAGFPAQALGGSIVVLLNSHNLLGQANGFYNIKWPHAVLLVQALFKLLVGFPGEDEDIGPENFISGQRVARGGANALNVASGQRNVVIGLGSN